MLALEFWGPPFQFLMNVFSNLFIEPAERESRRAPRGKPARPGFWTHGKTTPRCSILGGPIGIQFCIQISFVFFFLVTLGGCRFASFWFHFWSILEAFGLHFASFWGLLASIGRPWRGPWRRDCFSLIFGSQNGRKVEPQRLPKSIQNGFKIPLFFWSISWRVLVPNRSLKRSKLIKK